MVLALLSESVKRVSVSRIRDFCLLCYGCFYLFTDGNGWHVCPEQFLCALKIIQFTFKHNITVSFFIIILYNLIVFEPNLFVFFSLFTLNTSFFIIIFGLRFCTKKVFLPHLFILDNNILLIFSLTFNLGWFLCIKWQTFSASTHWLHF